MSAVDKWARDHGLTGLRREPWYRRGIARWLVNVAALVAIVFAVAFAARLGWRFAAWWLA